MAKYLLLDRYLQKKDPKNAISLKKLQPEKSTRIYYDDHKDAPKGFGLRVTPAGGMAWIVNYYIDGKERRLTLENGYSTWGPDRARKEASTIRARINSGVDILGEREKEKAELAAVIASDKPGTLRELDARYREKVTPATARASVLNWWIDQIGDLPLANIDNTLIVRKLETLAHEKSGTRTAGKCRSGATVNRYLAYLSIVFSYGVTIGAIQFNPAKGIKRNTEKGRVRYLGMEGYPTDEAERLLKACEAQNTTLYALVVTAMNTGARAGELRDLEWRDINFKDGSAILRETKNGETRYIPMTGKTMQVLKEMRGDGSIGKVFRANDGAKKYDYTNDWKAVVKSAEISNFRFHDLRHHAASMLAIKGVPLNQIAVLLGHKSLQVTQRYAHLSKKNVTDLGAILDGVNFQ